MRSENGILSISVLFSILSLFFIIASGCQKSEGVKLGVDIPKDMTVTKLASVLEDPTTYDGKSVVMKGVVSGQCAALCEFFFSDGAHTVTVFPQGFKFPKLETGKKVTVFAKITTGTEQVVVSALGLTIG